MASLLIAKGERVGDWDLVNKMLRKVQSFHAQFEVDIVNSFHRAFEEVSRSLVLIKSGPWNRGLSACSMALEATSRISS